MKKVTVLVGEGGEVVAAYAPSERRQPLSYSPDDPPSVELLPDRGQEVVELEVPDEDLRPDSASDFLGMLTGLIERRRSGRAAE